MMATAQIPDTLRHLVVPIADLRPYPQNPRAGDTDAIVESLRINSQYRPIVVRTSDNTILAGNHTYAAAMELGWSEIAATYIDVDDEEAARIVLVDNRSNDLARYDDGLLAALLADMPSLEGTGYDQQALDELLERVNEASTPVEHQIVGHSTGYDFRDIHAGKLAYRVEAAWRSAPGVALDLYSGHGQLAAWYARRFDRVVRVDAEDGEGIDHVESARSYLRGDFAAIADTVSFIDMDDEGSPGREIQTLFTVLPPERTTPFVLAVTDGSGLNMKLHGRFDPGLYAMAGPQRRATTDDYTGLEGWVSGCVERSATRAGWTAALWSSTRGSEGNVVYQTFGVTRTEPPVVAQLPLS
jgi:hypothetical protein